MYSKGVKKTGGLMNNEFTFARYNRTDLRNKLSRLHTAG